MSHANQRRARAPPPLSLLRGSAPHNPATTVLSSIRPALTAAATSPPRRDTRPTLGSPTPSSPPRASLSVSRPGSGTHYLPPQVQLQALRLRLEAAKARAGVSDAELRARQEEEARLERASQEAAVARQAHLARKMAGLADEIRRDLEEEKREEEQYDGSEYEVVYYDEVYEYEYGIGSSDDGGDHDSDIQREGGKPSRLEGEGEEEERERREERRREREKRKMQRQLQVVLARGDGAYDQRIRQELQELAPHPPPPTSSPVATPQGPIGDTQQPLRSPFSPEERKKARMSHYDFSLPPGDQDVSKHSLKEKNALWLTLGSSTEATQGSVYELTQGLHLSTSSQWIDPDDPRPKGSYHSEYAFAGTSEFSTSPSLMIAKSFALSRAHGDPSF